MSFLGSFNPFNIVKSIVQTGLNIVQNPVKGFSELGTIVVTGGASLVSPQIKQFADPLIAKLYDPALIPAVITATTHVPLLNAGGGYSVGNQPFLGSITLPTTAPPMIPQPPAMVQQGVTPMGLDLNGILGTVSNIFGGNQNPVFQGLSNVTSLAQQFVPQPAQQVAIRAPAPTLPAAGMLSRLPMIGRNFFQKFPNLATSIQSMRNAGRNVTRAQLYSLLKRFGPDLLITGGILTAAAVSELMMAGPGRRRMNPGNAKALRRSLRRIESFHHLCARVDRIRSPRRRSAKSGGRTTQQFVRQG